VTHVTWAHYFSPQSKAKGNYVDTFTWTERDGRTFYVEYNQFSDMKSLA